MPPPIVPAAPPVLPPLPFAGPLADALRLAFMTALDGGLAAGCPVWFGDLGLGLGRQRRLHAPGVLRGRAA